jgi:hypothetical protein
MTTKFIKLAAILVLTTTSTFGQIFEGKIVYENKYTSKIPNLNDQQFSSMMGSTQEYFIKGGNYKSVTNGTLMQWQLYINKDNKLYNKMANNPTILWNDGSVNADEVLKTEINKNVIEILGHQCDELILTCKSGVQKYYFSNKLKVDTKLYENHKFGNWSEYISKSGALPLKVIVDSPQFTLEGVAKEIKSITLEDKLFELPVDSKIQKSPY